MTFYNLTESPMQLPWVTSNPDAEDRKAVAWAVQREMRKEYVNLAGRVL